MKMKNFAAIALMCCSTSYSFAETGDLSLGLGASLPQGGGIEISYEFNNDLNLRGAYYAGSFKSNGNVDEINYALSYKSSNTGLMLDYYPMSGRSFKMVAGAYSNGNKFTAKASSSATYDIGDTTYTAAEVGSLTSAIGFDTFAPYAGLGYDMRATDALSINFELGVLFQGAPTVTMTTNGTLANDDTFASKLETERKKMEDELKAFKYLPALKISASYRF